MLASLFYRASIALGPCAASRNFRNAAAVVCLIDERASIYSDILPSNATEYISNPMSSRPCRQKGPRTAVWVRRATTSLTPSTIGLTEPRFYKKISLSLRSIRCRQLANYFSARTDCGTSDCLHTSDRPAGRTGSRISRRRAPLKLKDAQACLYVCPFIDSHGLHIYVGGG